MHTQPRAYHPLFEQALERLVIAATDTAEFAEGIPTGRSRQASIRQLKQALEELHRTCAAIVLAQRSTVARPAMR